MQFITPIEIQTKNFPNVNHSHQILSLGSCFSQHIGNKLERSKFNCSINPFGVLYNPASIAKTLDEIMEHKVYTASDLFEHSQQWHSWMHHGDFSNVDKQEVLNQINHRISVAHDFISELDYLMITFGSAWIYRLKQGGEVVSNCHKVRADQFVRERLDIDQIFELYSGLIDKLLLRSPKLKIVFSVSPIRHVRDGLHENQLSKSILLLAIDKLAAKYPNVIYFPSYEIVLDELRDYRFYADDMVHPSELAIEYIWEKFKIAFFDKQTLTILEECQKIEKSLSHRPLNPNTESYSSFLEHLIEKMKHISNKYPKLDFRKEIDTCRIQLMKLPRY